MSESDKTNELDNFGVWVKKPPRTVSSDETLSNEIAPGSTENKIADAGDNKMEDIDIDSFLDGADFSEAPSDETAKQQNEKKTPADGTEEVSLDEFLDGGVFESNDGGSAASEKSEQESKAASKEAPISQVTMNNFSTPDDITVSDSEPVSSSSDDSLLDIDLSFDDAPVEKSSQDSSEPQFETIDTSSASQSTELSSSKDSEDGTENIDLSEFGFDINAPESSSEENPAEKKEEPASSASQTNTEETGNPVSNELSQVSDISPDTSSASTDDSDLDSLSLDASSSATPSPELPDSTGIEMNVKADDDMEIAAPSENEKEVSSSEPKPEIIDDLNLTNSNADEIPDSFEEETASLFADEPQNDSEKEETSEPVNETVIEHSEPVFEETSVDLSELPDEIPEITDDEKDSDGKTLGNQNTSETETNPFTLPPDDAFVSSEKEDRAEGNDQTPASGQKSNEAKSTGPEKEETTENKIISATQGKDEEIAASTNAILSQIVSELASLKTEISGLKNEFNEIKAKEEEFKETPKTDKAEENTGFFSGNEDDDTIALSVDELDNILNNAEMVNEDSSENSNSDSESNDFEEPEVNPQSFEQNENDSLPETNALEETISDSENDDLLPDYTDDDGLKEDDIFVPKAEEISEAQSPIDFGNIEEQNENSSDLISEKESETSSTDSSDDLSIGDFSFDDENKTETSENDEVQPEETLSDETLKSIENSNSMSTPNSAAPLSDAKEEAEKTDENQNGKTVDEPFEFGSESELSENEAKESEAEPVKDENVAISNEELDHLLAQDSSINESLTDENLNYLSSDKEIANTDSEEKTEEDSVSSIPGNLKKEIKSVLSYMDQLLENLPEDKIAEFAQSEQFETYKKLFKELGLDKQ